MTVILPAKDEEALLPNAVAALATQCDGLRRRLDPRTYEVLVLLNNCIDRSRAVLDATARAHPQLRLHVAECVLPQHTAHVGTARRLLMDAACRRHAAKDQREAAIISTDADTVVAADWVHQNCVALRRGADVVGGVIELGAAECDHLARTHPDLLLAYRRDRLYQRFVAQLEHLLDPDPDDPWPRHLEHFGASLACTTAIYKLAGGLPAVTPLEDVAFVRALRKVGARLRHAPSVRVTTSGRLDGRAAVGLSSQLRQWDDAGALGRGHCVESVAALMHRFRSVAVFRRIHAGDASLADRRMGAQWLKKSRCASLPDQSVPLGCYLACIEADGIIDRNYPGTRQSRTQQITAALRDLERYVGEGAPAPRDETARPAASASLATLAG